jgi:RND family efflux transporter MFP subunit
VTVSKPTVSTVREYALFTGFSRAIESADVMARVEGVLETVDFEPSTEVTKGDLLFTIEKTKYKALRDAAEASYQSAQADLLRAETELKRVEKASKSRAVSEMDVDRAVADRDMSRAAVLSAEAQLADAELNLSYTRVVAPLTGIVSRNLVDRGNLVGQGGPTLLTTINCMDPMYVYFNVPENVVLSFLAARRNRVANEEDAKRGLKAFVALADEDGFPHEGVIDYVDNTVDPRTGTIEMRAVLPNADFWFFPGLFVRIKVPGDEIPGALVIPETALGTDLGGKYVYVVGEGNIVEQRYLTLGLTQGDGTVHVREGLTPEDTVIVNGIMFARPGLPVTPLTAEQFQAMLQQQAQQARKPQG